MPDIRRCLQTLPPTLNQTYERILLEIQRSSEANACRARAALQWLVSSVRPLNLPELAEAMVIAPRTEAPFDEADRFFDRMDAAEILSSLLSVQPLDKAGLGSPQVRLAHFSVQEYLTSTPILHGPVSMFVVEKNLANCFVLESIIYYLAYYQQYFKGRLADVWFRIWCERTLPLFFYATQCWKTHVRALELKPDHHTVQALLQFLVQGQFLCLEEASNLGSYVPWEEAFNKALDTTTLQLRFDCSLYYTCLQGFPLWVVEALLDHGAKPNPPMNGLDASLKAGPLHVAWRAESVDFLLRNGAVLEARNPKEQTSLHCLAEAGAVDAVRVLLEAGTDANAVDSDGHSALWFAIQKPPPGKDFYRAWKKKKLSIMPLIHLLLEHGADATRVDRNNETLLHTAATGPQAVLQYLLTLGIDVDCKSVTGTTALHKAIHDNNGPSNALTLIENHAALLADSNGTTPLHEACMTHLPRERLVRALLDAGADPRARDRWGQTPSNLLHSYTTMAYNELSNDPSGFVSAVADTVWEGSYQKVTQMLEGR
jgi:ankyrin repeat protein